MTGAAEDEGKMVIKRVQRGVEVVRGAIINTVVISIIISIALAATAVAPRTSLSSVGSGVSKRGVGDRLWLRLRLRTIHICSVKARLSLDAMGGPGCSVFFFFFDLFLFFLFDNRHQTARQPDREVSRRGQHPEEVTGRTHTQESELEEGVFMNLMNLIN